MVSVAGQGGENVVNRQLIIFIKNIEPGKVKTRLAATIGHEKALEVYQLLLQHTREVTLAIPAIRHLYYSQKIERNDDWPATEYEKSVQTTGDLGHKMSEAFREAFAAGREKVVIVGSDCIQLRPKHIEEAFSALDTHDLAIGPAKDGGYYMLGMRKFVPEVFENMEWSTEAVFQETVKRIEGAGKTWKQVTTLSDVDYEEDLEGVLLGVLGE